MTCSSPRVSSIFSESLSVPLMFLRVPSLPLLCLSSIRVSCSSVSYTVKVRCFHVWYASPVTSCLFVSVCSPCVLTSSVFLCQLLPWSCVAISLIFVRFPVCLFVSFVHIHFRFSLYFLWSGNKALFELLLPP